METTNTSNLHVIEFVKFIRNTLGKIRVTNCFLFFFGKLHIEEGEIASASILEVKFGLLEMHLKLIRSQAYDITTSYNEELSIKKQENRETLRKNIESLAHSFTFSPAELKFINSIKDKAKAFSEIENEPGHFLNECFNLQTITNDEIEDYTLNVFSFLALLEQVTKIDTTNKKSVSHLLEIL